MLEPQKIKDSARRGATRPYGFQISIFRGSLYILWRIIYNIFFNPFLVFIAIVVFSPVRKVRETLIHHWGIWERLKVIKEKSGKKPLIWFHVSSAGEYLMVKPVIDLLLKKKCKIFVSCTSISGYRWLKREANPAILFDFMPLDFFYNSKRVIHLMNPAALMFIRNDIWPNLKHEAVKKNIPVFFLGAPVRSINSVIKKSFYRFIYSEFKSIFTITDEAYEFHRGLNPHTTVIYAGDTKYDIVISRKNERKIKIPKPGSPCILLGSVWPDDLRVIVPALLNSLQTNPLCTFIIAPHEITTASINYLLFKFERYNPVLYSEFKQKPRKFQVLIVDTIGDLFFLYENSSIAYVGGGFGTGIHNILEPAAMGNVVIFGPKHEKFPEAKYLIDSGCAFCVKSREEFENIFYDLMDHVQKVKKLAGQSQSAVMKQTGASQVVFTHLVKTLSLKGISKN